MSRKLKSAYIVNNATFGFGKEYIILDKITNKLVTQQTYRTITDATNDARLAGYKIVR